MAEKLDYKKEYKDLYVPGKKPALVEVPAMNFICVQGRGAPDGEAYQKAIQTLYSLSFTIKMSKMSGEQPVGYFEYVVPSLEGLWWCGREKMDMERPRSEWQWISMIRQPDFVTKPVFAWALEQCRKKKPEVDVSAAAFASFEEGLCVQALHIGPYSEEPRTLAALSVFIEENGLVEETGFLRKHHEIYLSDPRRTAPEKLKTVLRLPVAKA